MPLTLLGAFATAPFTSLLRVGGLILGCVPLLRETRIAGMAVSEEAGLLWDHFATRTMP